jgi:hypothetical protein
MKRRELKLYASGGALLLGLYWGARIGPRPAVGDVLLAGYACWALFWGIPPVWRYWRRWAARLVMSGCSAFGWPLAVAIWVSLFVTSVWFYSLLGGGIYEFIKCLRGGRRPVSGP